MERGRTRGDTNGCGNSKSEEKGKKKMEVDKAFFPLPLLSPLTTVCIYIFFTVPIPFSPLEMVILRYFIRVYRTRGA